MHFALGGILVLVAGCSPSFDWSGSWTGNRNLPTKPGQNPSIAYTIGKVDLTIEPSGRFTLIEGGVPKTGTASLSDQKAELRIETYMDRPIARLGSGAEAMNQPVILRAQKDGSITLVDPTGFDPAPIVLRRVEKRGS